jgi:hypothetical protein
MNENTRNGYRTASGKDSGYNGLLTIALSNNSFNDCVSDGVESNGVRKGSSPVSLGMLSAFSIWEKEKGEVIEGWTSVDVGTVEVLTGASTRSSASLYLQPKRIRANRKHGCHVTLCEQICNLPSVRHCWKRLECALLHLGTVRLQFVPYRKHSSLLNAQQV